MPICEVNWTWKVLLCVLLTRMRMMMTDLAESPTSIRVVGRLPTEVLLATDWMALVADSACVCWESQHLWLLVEVTWSEESRCLPVKEAVLGCHRHEEGLGSRRAKVALDDCWDGRIGRKRR